VATPYSGQVRARPSDGRRVKERAVSHIDEFRRAKDEFFRDDPQSPLTPEQRHEFSGLAYYEENPALDVALVPEPFAERELLSMQTSTGNEAAYERWGRVRFEIEGEPAELTLYRDPHSGSFFLPFQDANAGGETYGAGRYLEVQPDEDGRLRIDFNYAYNPYCAYNEHWSCPIPPAENHLRVAIRAGEKSFPGAN
jgi:uncharacterized protein (DUF1684 family)